MRQSTFAVTGIKKEFWGKALNLLRQGQNLSLTELARSANCTKSNLSAIENGANWPTTSIILTYERMLGLASGEIERYAAVLSSDGGDAAGQKFTPNYVRVHPGQSFSSANQAASEYSLPAGIEEEETTAGLSAEELEKFKRQDFYLQLAQTAFENSKFDELKSLLAELKPRTLKGRNKAHYYYLLGLQEIEAKDFKTARVDLNEALTLFNALPEFIFDPLDRARVKSALGTSFYREGNYHQATLEHESVLRDIENGSVNDAAFQMELYYKIGADYHMAGKNPQAIQFLTRASEMAAHYPTWKDRLAVYWSMALAYRSEQDLSRAKYYLKLSADGYQQLNNLRFASLLNGMLGLIMVERQEYTTAGSVLDSALEDAKELKDDELIGKSYINLAYLQNEEGNYLEAAENAHQALEIAQKSSDKLFQAQAFRQLADIEVNLNHLQEGLALYEQALAAVEETTSQEYLDRILYGYAEALDKAGDQKKAIEIYRRTKRY